MLKSMNLPLNKVWKITLAPSKVLRKISGGKKKSYAVKDCLFHCTTILQTLNFKKRSNSPWKKSGRLKGYITTTYSQTLNIKKSSTTFPAIFPKELTSQ